MGRSLSVSRGPWVSMDGHPVVSNYLLGGLCSYPAQVAHSVRNYISSSAVHGENYL